MLARTGLVAMIGKAERGPTGIEAIKRNKAAYLMAVGGAAYLVAKAIRASRVLAFGVITSYSIHYTKLYDPTCPGRCDAG